MNELSIEERSIRFGEYLVDNNSTVREVAKKFSVSKSTVHKDITENLKRKDINLYKKVRNILDKNKKERHIRGGVATQKKYLEIRKSTISE